jgi:hypothetical protein
MTQENNNTTQHKTQDKIQDKIQDKSTQQQHTSKQVKPIQN